MNFLSYFCRFFPCSFALLISLFLISLNAHSQGWGNHNPGPGGGEPGDSNGGGTTSGHIDIAFIVDDDVLAVDDDVDITIADWLISFNEYLAESGVNLTVGLADIRIVDVGTTSAVSINRDMLEAKGVFHDIRSYTDRMGADFTVTVVDGLTKDGRITGGLAYINGERDNDWDYDLVSDFVDYCLDTDWTTCTSGNGWLSDTWDDLVDSVEDGFGEIADFLIGGTQEILELIGVCNNCIPIPNLSEHKYFVSSINYENGALTLAHEVGHNMGLVHGQHVFNVCGEIQNQYDHRGYGIESYSSGYAEGDCDGVNEPNEFKTIMVGNYGDGRQVPLFSSPEEFQECDGPCGNSRSDAVRSINRHLHRFNKQSKDASELDYADTTFALCLRESYANLEVSQVRDLACNGYGVRAITGISQLKSLETISLIDNQVVNAQELIDWNEDLSLIDLSGNETLMCSHSRQLREVYGHAYIEPSSCFNVAALIVSINHTLL